MKNILIIFIVLLHYADANDSYYYQNNQKIILTPQHTLLRSTSNFNYYNNEKGLLLGVSDTLIVKYYKEVNIGEVLSLFNLALVKTLGENLYLLQTSNKDLTLDISNKLSQREEVKYAHPNFLKKRMKR